MDGDPKHSVYINRVDDEEICATVHAPNGFPLAFWKFTKGHLAHRWDDGRLTEYLLSKVVQYMRYALNVCAYTESYGETHTYTFTGPCMKTGKPYSVTVPAAGLYRYHQGVNIQDAFPDLSSEDREFLMSGYSPEGWNQIFPKDGSDEDGDDGDDSDDA